MPDRNVAKPAPARQSTFNKSANWATVSQADLDRAKRWSIGQPVTLTKDDGSTVETQTRSAPFQVRGTRGTWVILLNGISGYYAVARVKER